ncbi:MAG: hypothetical protein JXR89_08185, partial [Deltaproteobacteria bacterium]|nr:hypothetical protein [Deltaproteobacteria bacterium]
RALEALPAAGRGPGGGPAAAELALLRRELSLVKGGLTRLLQDSGLDEELPPCLRDLRQQLCGRRVAATIVDELIAECCEEIRPRLGGAPSAAWLVALARAAMARQLLTRVRGLAPEELGRVITLLGPTGVGKTTSLAKLAAFLQKRGQSVGLISVDTFRLGAVAQIEEYGRRLSLPVRVVGARKELAQALSDLAGCDRILIDSMGRSARDFNGLAALFRLLRGLAGSPLLVLPAAVGEDDLLEILVHFRPFACRALLFTKLDETSGYGSILNGLTYAGLPLSFFADGQQVPDDFEVAGGERLADLLLDLTAE